jgi:hypothetical protein
MNDECVMTPAPQVQDLFKPLLGQLAWHVRCGIGSFLTLEFGEPHIVTREPIVAGPRRSEQARRDLARRRIFVVGDWHLWIQYCDWKISVSDYSLNSGSAAISSDECLSDLDGQRLVAVTGGVSPNSWKFDFDLGGALELWPSTAYEASDNLWSLHGWNTDIADLRCIAALRGDGALVFEQARGPD